MSSRPPAPIQPLTDRVPITNEDGTPTTYFIRYLQERGLDINGRVTPSQVAQMIEDWSAGRFVNTNFPLSGGGALNADLTLDHEPSGVAAGVYGDATNVPQFNVDADGHITDVTEVPISGGGGGNWWFQPPAVADFTTATGGAHGWASLTDDADEGLLFDAGVAFAGDDTIYAYKAISSPSTDWVATIRCSPTLPAANFSAFGILVQNSANSRIQMLALANGLNGWTIKNLRLNPSSFNDETAIAWQGNPQWLRLAKVGTNLLSYVSSDGKAWTLFNIYAIATWLAANPDRVGFGVLYNRATGANVVGGIQYWNFT